MIVVEVLRVIDATYGTAAPLSRKQRVELHLTHAVAPA